MKPIITLVVPCYNEEATLQPFYDEITRVAGIMSDVTLNVLFVDDGSADNTLNEMKRLAALDSHIQYISFSRNFGKEAAIYAGLQQAKGDYVAIMDADLLYPPSLLREI